LEGDADEALTGGYLSLSHSPSVRSLSSLCVFVGRNRVSPPFNWPGSRIPTARRPRNWRSAKRPAPQWLRPLRAAPPPTPRPVPIGPRRAGSGSGAFQVPLTCQLCSISMFRLDLALGVCVEPRPNSMIERAAFVSCFRQATVAALRNVLCSVEDHIRQPTRGIS